MEAEIRYDNPTKPYGKGYYFMMGGMSSNPTWEEYLREVVDEFKPHFEAIKKAIEGAGMVGRCADTENIANRIHFRCRCSDGGIGLRLTLNHAEDGRDVYPTRMRLIRAQLDTLRERLEALDE